MRSIDSEPPPALQAEGWGGEIALHPPPGLRQQVREWAPASAYRFAAVWALGWATVGSLVAAGITFTRDVSYLSPVLVISVLFAEVVGFSALISQRLIFPLFAPLPWLARVGLQIVTLFSGTLFGSVVVLATQPLFSLARPKTVAVIVLLNMVCAVGVGIALHTYETMRRQIEASYLALRQKEALEREIAIAREVQRELLPRSVPRIRGLDLAGVCIPAVGVGGDYYDFLPLSPELVGVVIADVAGKGIPAALLMAGLQGSVRSLARPGVPPSEVNRRLNDMLHESTSDSRYATFFFALFDGASRKLTYSNAGHLPPLLLGHGGSARLTEGGLPIGVFGGSAYGEGGRQLFDGDLLAFYTDGIVEAQDAQGREFGEARLAEILEGHRLRPLEETIEVVVDEVRRWTKTRHLHDDLTLVLARVG